LDTDGVHAPACRPNSDGLQEDTALRTTPRLVLCTFIALAFVVSACGGDDDDSATPSDDTEQPGDDVTAPTGPGSGEDPTIDACTLLSDDEAIEILGAPLSTSGPTSGVGESVCGWETAESYSVTVAVGTVGTAPGNEFEPDEALGTPEPVSGFDGAFFLSGGQVDFPAGERHNYVQVVTSVTDDSDRPKAEELAKTIAQRIEDAS
jgi:hypothetical protein